jgi:hypothetical protein
VATYPEKIQLMASVVLVRRRDRRRRDAPDRSRAPPLPYADPARVRAVAQQLQHTARIAPRRRIQTSNTAGAIFRLVLKQQKMKPAAGNPNSSRVGVRVAMLRVVSFT